MAVSGAENFAVITVDDVDINNRSVGARDKTGSYYAASFRNMPGGIVYVPAYGEQWVVQRVGHIWYLHSRLSTLDEQAVIESLPEGSNNIFGTLYANGTPWGATHVETATSSSFANLNLTAAPVSTATVQVFFAGALLAPTAWSLTAKTLVFSPALGTGTVVVYYQA